MGLMLARGPKSLNSEGLGLTLVQGPKILGLTSARSLKSLNSEESGLTLVQGPRVGTYACTRPEELEL